MVGDPKIYDAKLSAFTKLKKFVTVSPNMN